MKLKNGLAILLATSACFAFVACEEEPAPAPAPAHEHTWATEWSKDGENHWLACTGEDCTEVKDKAGHEWNAGEITTQPSASADGVKTYTCTVCSQTKTEAVAYVVDTEVTAEEWLAALSFENEDNYSFVSISQNVTSTTEFDGVSAHSMNYMGGVLVLDAYVTKEGEKYYSINRENGVRAECTEAEYENMRSAGNATTFLYSSFSYDEASKTYKADEISFSIGEGMTMTYSDIEIKFENKRIVKMTYKMENPILGADEGELIVTYGNVDTIVLPDLDITEEEWNANKEKLTNYALPKTLTYTTTTTKYVMKTDGVNLFYDTYDTNGTFLRSKGYVMEDTKYYEYSKEGEGIWTAQEIDQTSYEQNVEDKLDMAINPFFMPNYQYIEKATDGSYSYMYYSRLLSYYFVDNTLIAIRAKDEGLGLVVQFGNPTIEIPVLPNLRITSASDWDAAFTKVTDMTSVRIMYMKICNETTENLLYTTSITADLVQVQHVYYDVIYQKTGNDEIYEYMNNGGNGWVKTQRTDRPWEYLVNSAISSGGYGSYILGIGSYDSASYVAQGGYYEYSIEDNTYRAYFVDGELAKLEMYNDGVKLYVFTFDYNTPIIEIPQVQ